MKDKDYLCLDRKKISKDIYNNKEFLELVLKIFLSDPIVLTDKRRNPKYYTVVSWEIGQSNDDVLKELYTIVRTIKYKKKLTLPKIKRL